MTPEEKHAALNLLGYRILVEPSHCVTDGTYVALGTVDKTDEQLAGWEAMKYKHYGPTVKDPLYVFLREVDLGELPT